MKLTAAPLLVLSCTLLGCPSQVTPQATDPMSAALSATCESLGVALPAGFADAPTVPVPVWPTQYAPVQAPWNGGVQYGKSCAVQTTESVTIYRVFGGPAKQMGFWWSPTNATTAYAGASEWRSANAVCVSFNDASELAACTVPAGTTMVLGATQSIVIASAGEVSCLYDANDSALQLNLTAALPSTTPCVVEATPDDWRGR